MRIIVTITLKDGVLDPEGRSIENALMGLGWQEINQVSTAKQIILDMDEEDEARACQKVAKMCETMLANTVIEDYNIEPDTNSDEETG